MFRLRPKCYVKMTRSCLGTISKQVLKHFESVVGHHAVVISAAKREQHGHDESYHVTCPPAVVLFPETTEHVSKIVSTCSANKIPIIPFGTGTGLEGGVCAQDPRSVCIDLSLMKNVEPPNVDDFDVTVEAGVTRLELNRVLSCLKMTGNVIRNWRHKPVKGYLYERVYAIASVIFTQIKDPGADASLCGMVATNASGTMAVRYGTMRQNVLNLQVVLPDGRIVDTAGSGRRARKSSAGYNLTSLFIGSEGTLGVITKATLRLHPFPPHVAFASAKFRDALSAVNAAVDIMKNAIPVARIEFVDEIAVRASNKFSQLEQEENPTLMLEVHASSPAGAEEQTALIREVCELHGTTGIVLGKDVEEQNKMWKARHDALYAAQSLRPNSKCLLTDVCVPISQLPGVVSDAKKWLTVHGLTGTVIGHVGDGNFHVIIPIVDSEKEMPEARKYATRLGIRAIDAGGTCTGEHGIGLGKKHLLKEEVGEIGIELMNSIKCAVDPRGLMNPGKVIG